MTYINHVVVSIVLLTTAAAFSFSIVALTIPQWRSVIVSVNSNPVLNGTEGLWTYCEYHKECVKLNTENTGSWLIGVRTLNILSSVLFLLALVAIIARLIGGCICTQVLNKTKCQTHALLVFLAAILLLVSAMLYGEKVNYDEANYTNGWSGVVKRQVDFSTAQRYALNNLFDRFKTFMDSLPTKAPLRITTGTTTTPEGVSLPPHITDGYESRDDVFYKAEVGYCYHLGIFGSVVGFVTCGLSLYQSWRDSNISNGIQRL